MGLGDDLMITGFVEREHEKYPDKQIVIGNLNDNLIFDSIVYLNNPKIIHSSNLDKNKPVHFINYNDLNRFYINYKECSDYNLVWRTDFKLIPGKIYFSKKEVKDADNILNKAYDYWFKNNSKKPVGTIFFESYSTKGDQDFYSNKMINKNWGEENWRNLINKLKNKYLIIQSVHKEAIRVNGTFYANNEFDFRTACALMNRCNLFVGNEGAFGHAAAALNKKGVVYFGGWISPQSTGYDIHENIYYKDNESPCGAVGYICNHCKKARINISVNYLEDKINQIFQENII